MNVKLLRRIQKHIAAVPGRYDQHTYGTKVDGSDAPACGTKACIAGWAYILGKDLDPRKVSDGKLWAEAASKGQALLGLDSDQANRLFADEGTYTFGDGDVIEGWPSKFWKAYKKAKTAAGRASVAVRRIDHFIKTKGAE